MRELFNLDSPVMRVLNRLAELMILNVLALICALPVVTLGASATGLYTAVQSLSNDEGHPARDFFRGFRQNFVQATLLWLFFLISGILLAFGLIFYASLEGAVFNILLVGAVFAAIIWIFLFTWSFPLLAKFHISTGAVLSNALICAVGYLPRSIIMSVNNLIPLFLLYFDLAAFLYGSVLWILIWFALAAYLNILLLKKPYERMISA